VEQKFIKPNTETDASLVRSRTPDPSVDAEFQREERKIMFRLLVSTSRCCMNSTCGNAISRYVFAVNDRKRLFWRINLFLIKNLECHWRADDKERRSEKFSWNEWKILIESVSIWWGLKRYHWLSSFKTIWIRNHLYIVRQSVVNLIVSDQEIRSVPRHCHYI